MSSRRFAPPARSSCPHLLDLSNPAALHDVVVDHDVLPVELYLLLHVGKESANLGGQVDHVGWGVLSEDLIAVGTDSEGKSEAMSGRVTFVG